MFTVYSKENCPSCDNAKKYLTKLGKEYKTIMVTEFAIDDNEITKEEFVNKFPGIRTVPYIIGPSGEIYKNFNELIANVK